MSRVAVVVGASSGIGWEIARLLAKKEGLDRVYALARRADKLASLKEKAGEKIVPVVCDVTKTSAFACLKEDDSLIYAVNAAGIGYHGAATEIPVEKQTALVDLNCKALTRFGVECAKKIERGGKIVIIASASAFLPQPYFAVYAASKSFALSFCRALGKELSARKITVTAICPGPVDTEFFSISEPTGQVSEKKKKYLVSPVFVAKRSLSAAEKGKSVYTPTLSMKGAKIAAKLFPHSLLMKVYKEN